MFRPAPLGFLIAFTAIFMSSCNVTVNNDIEATSPPASEQDSDSTPVDTVEPPAKTPVDTVEPPSETAVETTEDTAKLDTSMAMSFEMDSAVAVVAISDIIDGTRSPETGSLEYHIVGGSAARMGFSKRAGESKVAGSNLLAWGAEGELTPAMETNRPTKVMYSVNSPSGDKIYLALDTGWMGNDEIVDADGRQLDLTRGIAESNCALWEVTVATNDHRCVAEGIFLRLMNEDYMKDVSGNQKPIQFDQSGNMYFVATSFTRDQDTYTDCYLNEVNGDEICEDVTNYWIDGSPSWMPIVYRYAADGTISTMSQDTDLVSSFLVQPSGELVYQFFNQDTLGNGLKIIRENGSISEISDPDIWTTFFAIDSSNTIVYGTEDWGGSDADGIQLARPNPHSVTHFANLDASLFGSNSNGSGWQSPTPRRVILADDGRMYGIFEGGRDNYDAAQNSWNWTQSLKVYQILPFDAVPKLELDLGADWWAWMQGTPFQIANGYLYYTDTVAVPGWNRSDVIKIVNLDTRDTTTLLNPVVSYNPLIIEERYTIYNWRLSGDTLFFSALNLDTNTAVTGVIDTKAIFTAWTEADYLTIQESASASGSASAVQDIEVINATVLADDGDAPIVLELLTDSENMFSLSIDFSEPMDHESVEDTLTLTSSENTGSEGEDGVIPFMSLWIGSTLHMVPDLQSSETGVPTWYPSLALLYPTTVPMTYDETYTMDGFAYTMTDQFNNELWVPIFSASENVVTIRPQIGWYTGALAQSTPAAIAGGDILKLAVPLDQYNWSNYTLHSDLPANFRVEFSAVNFGWDGLQLAVFDQENETARENDDWWQDTLIKTRFGNWSETRYIKTRQWDSGDKILWSDGDDWEHGETRNVFNGKWSRYRMDVFGANIQYSVSTDGVGFTTISITGSDSLQDFNAIDFVGLADANNDANNDTEYHLVMRTVSPLALDRLEVTTLTVGGDLTGGGAGDLVTWDGSSKPAALSTAATYSFESW